MGSILRLDISGQPRGWVGREAAAGIDAAPLQPGQMAPAFELPNLAEDAGNTSRNRSVVPVRGGSQGLPNGD